MAVYLVTLSDGNQVTTRGVESPDMALEAAEAGLGPGAENVRALTAEPVVDDEACPACGGPLTTAGPGA